MNIKLKDGKNVYKIEAESSGCTLLTCVDFYSRENLGDGIVCSRLNQQVWIAYRFNNWRYEEVK